MTDPAMTTKAERKRPWQQHAMDCPCVNCRMLDDADAADALRAQVAALQAENERLWKAYTDVVAGQEVLIQLQRREWPLMQAELAAAQAKLAIQDQIEAVNTSLRHQLQETTTDNAALRTQAEALERERDGLRDAGETLRDWIHDHPQYVSDIADEVYIPFLDALAEKP